MAAPKKIKALVERFVRNRDAYISGGYNEAQVRQEFINPMFIELGWDVNNDAGFAEAYKDVVHEDALRIGGAHKAPDYSFRVGGRRKFFLEAKKPSVDIKNDIHPAYQIRRYAWSAKLPLSILTDFDEFAAYDCRMKPLKTDEASTARIIYFRHTELDDKWEEIHSIFSKDAVYKGDYDRFIESTKKKRGTTEVDDTFLQEIERWREMLAKNIAIRNDTLDEREINFVLGRTIDRIIFLRMCEDRGVEEYGRLQSLKNGTEVYSRLKQLYYLADERFNSGLFHFREEKNIKEPPDDLSMSVSIDDKPLKDIFKHLYYPDSPFEFSVLPPEILGQVYEQFLGKVVRLTKGHRAVVEYKPEVKKAGGVYYTPEYIVEYIVKNTVGKVLEGMNSAQASKLKIVDPACGSGSFLLNAYQFLLDWYLEKYSENPSKHKKVIYKVSQREWRLTTAERKRVLLNNIFGVDIDAQAVEVTKLSLLLKVLEGETGETLQQSLKLYHERALPDLSKNIKCGNSLIGSDFYDNQQLDLLDDDERYRINVFDWEDEFPETFSRKNPGFDVVIGNPPWVDIKGMDPKQVDYFFSKYSTTQNRMNIYATFIHKSINSLNKRGYLGYITPISFYTQSSYSKLRKYILKEIPPSHLIRMPDRVFKGVTAESAITVLSKHKSANCFVRVYLPEAKIKAVTKENMLYEAIIPNDRWQKLENYIFSIYLKDTDFNLVEKIAHKKQNLIDICDFSLGLTPYDKYKGHSQNQINNKVFHADRKRDGTFKPLLTGKDINRYYVEWNKQKWISYGEWLGAPREKKYFTNKRILVRQIISGEPPRIYAGYAEEEIYNAQIAFNLLLKPQSEMNILVVLGILNSKLITFFHRIRYLDPTKKVFQKILIQDAKKFPFPVIKLIEKEEKKRYDKMVKLVKQMNQLNKEFQNAKTSHKKEVIQRQINATDKQIDKLVYKLYDLTEKEIAIVEGSVT